MQNYLVLSGCISQKEDILQNRVKRGTFTLLASRWILFYFPAIPMTAFLFLLVLEKSSTLSPIALLLTAILRPSKAWHLIEYLKEYLKNIFIQNSRQDSWPIKQEISLFTLFDLFVQRNIVCDDTIFDRIKICLVSELIFGLVE